MRPPAPGSSIPALDATALLFDQRASRPEFTDARTRLALLTAIDRDAIVATELSGPRRPAPMPIRRHRGPTYGSADPEVKQDGSAAADLLKDAGWTTLKAGGWAAPGRRRRTTSSSSA